jgi:CspA family cold shock protein
MARNGTVRFFHIVGGFGFLTPEDGSKEVYVDASALEAAGIPVIDDGDEITYDLEEDPRGNGQRATNVQLAIASAGKRSPQKTLSSRHRQPASPPRQSRVPRLIK